MQHGLSGDELTSASLTLIDNRSDDQTSVLPPITTKQQHLQIDRQPRATRVTFAPGKDIYLNSEVHQ